MRHISIDTPLLTDPDETSTPVGTLKLGDSLRILDNSLGWAWGYGPDGRVGYVKSEFLVA